MRSKLWIYFLPVLLVTFLIYGYSTQDDPNADTAPLSDASSNYQSVNSVPGDTLYTFIVPSEIILGVNKLGSSPRLVFSSGGQSSAILTDNIWIRTTMRGARIDSFPQIGGTAGQGFGFRDLAWDGRFILASDNNQIRRIDTTTFTENVPRITVATTLNRGLAQSSVNRIWTSDFTTAPVRMVDTTGAIIKVLGTPPVAPYGLGADRWTSPGRMWLWYAEPSTAGTIRISKVDTSNGTLRQTYTYNFGTAASSGGVDVMNDHPDYPGRVVLVTAIQRFPTSAVVFIDLGPDSSNIGPPGGGTITVCRNGIFKQIPENGGNANPGLDTLTVSGIPAGNVIQKISVKIDTVIHTYIGDLRFWLTHDTGVDTIISRVGWTGTGFGNSCNDFIGTNLIDSVGPINIQNIPSACLGTQAQTTGTFNPKAPLSALNGINPNGTYILRVSDNAGGDTGRIRAWCVTIKYGPLVGVSNNVSVVDGFKLSQNYPNPFNPTTKIDYSIPKSGLVTIKIYDVIGKEVATLVNEFKNPGNYDVSFNGANLSSGVYFYRIESGSFIDTKKMFLLK